VRIQGYAAVFGRVDRAGDVIAPGAFADAMAGAGAVPLLRAHRGPSVGTIEAIGQDARGLRIAARVEDAETARLVRCGALPGLSVGYRALAVRRGARRVIAQAALVEISLVAVPMQPLARVERVSTEERA